MESNYDEDLSENTFFKTLQKEFYDLFEKATGEGWIICVPRAGSMPKYALTANDFFSHILIPNDELPETHFRTLNGKDVRICNRVVVVESDISSTFNTHILFEETYYTEDMLKYKVLCIEFPLQQYSEGMKTESGIVTVNNLRDCIDLLWTESCKEVLEKMDDAIQTFLSVNNKLEFKPLQEEKDLVGGLYIKCLQIALKDSRLREKTNMNRHLLDNVKISVESYIHHGIYKKLIKGISGCTAYDDACFNKIVRNLCDIQLRDLKIAQGFQSVIPKARNEIRKVDGYSTIIGKIGCLKKTISAITNLDSSFSHTNILAADELLPMLVFLIIKSGIPNWIAHLTFMKEFSFSSSNYHANQHNFLITSLEAAITYIRTDLIIGPSEPESQIVYEEDCIEEKNPGETQRTGLKTLFEMAKQGNEEEVYKILEKKDSPTSESLDGLNLCHPLCSCDKCERELSINLCNMNPTVNSCDDRGFTVLHISAMYGHAKVVDIVLNLGSKPDKSDYRGATALHYASSRGHQNALLVLIHAGAKLDQPDSESNTPLHCAAANGHDSCVKAILYFIEQMGITYDMNYSNNQGETALHNASRWGYNSIVSILLEYGASPYIENKWKLTPLDVAHNIHILNLLLSTKYDRRSTNVSLSTSSSSEIAVVSKSQLDFSDEDEKLSSSSNTVGIRPNSTDGIRKIERVLRAITFGDIRLACFYLGLELNTHESTEKPCHPLCPCKNRDDLDSSFGDIKVTEPMDVNVCNSDGLTPLHESAKCGRSELVRLLIDACADVNVRTRLGMTPFHLACENGKTRVAHLLLGTGAIDINAKDNFGNTALHYASQTNNLKLLNLLLDNNAACDIKNHKGKTPIDIAKEFMLISTVQLLINQSQK